MFGVWLTALAWAGAPVVSVVDTPQAIQVDGVLDESAWSTVSPVTEFLRFQPTEGGPPPGTTEVRFLQDERALYVGVKVRDAGYPIRGRLSARDDVNDDDQVGIYLDTFHDARAGYIFYVTCVGIQQDIRYANGKWSFSFETPFRSAGRIVEGGYDIEIAIPWRSVKYPRDQAIQDWGVVVTRKIPSEGYKYGFPKLATGSPRIFTEAATLAGVNPAPAGSGLELIPGLTVGQTWPRDDAASPWTGLDAPLEVVRPSLDARLGLTPDLGFTAAVNPDFSQVESDERDVRLNPEFAYYLPETRPLFLDGQEFYTDVAQTLYSRSMNDPLYGVKLQGRQGHVQLGALNALDRHPLASFHEAGTPGFSADDVAGRWAEDSLVRGRLDAFGTGFVGATLADKRLLGTPDAPGAAGSFDSAGLDVSVPVGDRWSFLGFSSASVFSPGPTDGWVPGGTAGVHVERASGDGTGFEGWLGGNTTDYRQELGFVNQTGLGWVGGVLDHTFEGSGFVDVFMPEVGVDVTEELNGEYARAAHGGAELTVGGVHDLWFEVGPAFRRQNIGGTPEAPDLVATVQGWDGEAGYYGQVGAMLTLNPEVAAGRTIDFASGNAADYQDLVVEATLRPGSGFRLDASGQVSAFTPVGDVSAHSHRVRGRVNWQFDKSLGLRAVGEQSGGDDLPSLLDTSALFGWLPSPGTAAYLGASQTTDLATREPVERTVFGKVTVLLRP